MDSSSQDRNLPASERKLKKAREDGQVLRSKYLSHLAILGTGGLVLMAASPLMFERFKLGLSQQLSFNAASIIQPADMLVRLETMAFIGIIVCVLFAAIVLTVALGSSIATGGWVTSFKPLTPDFSRINPLSGFGKLFSKEKVTDVLKLVFLTTILITIATSYFNSSMQGVATLVRQPSAAIIQYLADWLSAGMGLLLLVIVTVTLVDIPLQAYLHKSRLKMSHQEVKEEHKESEGNPEVKSKRRARQREIANGNSIREVPKADFVVMNPTHFAVAIKYDEKSMRAPQVISKGADMLAMRIRDLAKNNAIPVLQSPMLARALYANSELNQDIPSGLYTAVAQVLAYVYRLKAAMRGEGPMPADMPEPFVPAELDPQANITTKASKP
ncbi:MAG: EscU/YscU/HrcU family type III secretion system export apparatus switch protein [Gammaproteobacteria bacterium]|jgi:flagellar biosynthetic protein FlhB|nr:EscU/YscU/HrcU family type III secretion system export apparatus switch protein [Gammaproteobacteria bacterium]MBU0785917.1 EscU/YscU/HrcU family type III secretion system export apparatus switch protein [Gammaproteobacteria bacterium]MBU0816530.1 EscU/YscU/HrcU family type III secretion system export apparatus switch protein [Gammaproteobacteria bacterium]MBU1788331.1 EscU/YscU/HrcU family type III secretion system export apparatus switch protein [Gammaproteobacteria bacterium]